MGARCSLEEPVCTAAPVGSRRRARGDGVCSCGAESPSPVFFWWLVSGSRLSRERATASFFFGHSLAPPLVCKKRRRLYTNNTLTWWLRLRDRPGLRQRPGGGHSSPLQVVSVQAALSVVFQGSSAAPRSPRPQPRPSCSTVVGGRESWLWYRKWPSEIRCCSGCSERSSSKLCYHVGACFLLSHTRNQAALAPLGPASLRSPHVIV